MCFWHAKGASQLLWLDYVLWAGGIHLYIKLIVKLAI